MVTLGDLIEKDIESFRPVMQEYSKLKVPHYKVYGNHDFDMADEMKSRVQEAMEMPDTGYYSKKISGWRFVFLDGTEVSTYRYPKGSPQTLEAAAVRKKLIKAGTKKLAKWNSAVSEKQLEWLDAQLSEAKQQKQRVIVMNHFPVMPAGDGHLLWNSADLLKTLAKHDNVAAYFNGHNHRGNYTQHHGVHHLNFKGMVETANKSAFAVVTCYPDRIEVEGFESEPDRNLSI